MVDKNRAPLIKEEGFWLAKIPLGAHFNDRNLLTLSIKSARWIVVA